jgi:hypothetical protein
VADFAKQWALALKIIGVGCGVHGLYDAVVFDRNGLEKKEHEFSTTTESCVLKIKRPSSKLIIFDHPKR